MQYRSVKGFTSAGALGMLLVFLGLGFILAGGAQFIIGMKMVPEGTSMEKMGDAMLKAMLDPKNVGLARLSQFLGTLCLLFIPVMLYNLVVNGKNTFWLGFNKHITPKQILIGFGIIFFANMMAVPVADFSKSIIANFPKLDAYAKNLEEMYNQQVLALSNLKSWPEYLMAIFIMAFCPALFEEVFFRGALQNIFEKWWKSPFMAILISSIIFSLIHFSIYLFLTRLVLGFVLGMMYYKTKNIWVNIVAHFLNNAFAVTQLFILSRQNKPLNVEDTEFKITWWMGLLAFAVVFSLFKALEKASADKKARIEAQEQVLLAKEDPFRSFADVNN
ncbi:MAG: CPBP family intramembrane metalloprotease [Sphingobacteriales bacterium]|nr:MAG: CPBP family intramembrane metalloprotease [Sphingobacteriales bacterium]